MNKMPKAFRPIAELLEDRLVPTAPVDCCPKVLYPMGQSSTSLFQASISASFSFSAQAQFSSQSSSISSTTTTTITGTGSASATSSVTASLSGGVLHISGSARADLIVLRSGHNLIHIAGMSFRADDCLEIVIHGKGGNDVIDCRGLKLPADRVCSIFGDAGNDTILGGSCAEIIHGGAGDDKLIGNGGKDYLCGGQGNDRLEGCQGDDLLDGGQGRDHLLGGLGADTLLSALDGFVDRLDGGGGLDTILPSLIGTALSHDVADILLSMEFKFPWHPGNPPGQTPTSKAVSVDTLRADLAGRLGVPVENVHVVRVEEGYWPDTSLGCPEPGMAYAQVLVRGRRVVLEANNRTYEYHTDDAFTGRFVLCESPMGTLYPL